MPVYQRMLGRAERKTLSQEMSSITRMSAEISSAGVRESLETLPTEELVSLRQDMHNLHSLRKEEARRLQDQAVVISGIIASRERLHRYQLSDHAVLRWIERRGLLDLSVVREEMLAAADSARGTVSVTGEAEGLVCGDMVMVVAKPHNCIVTVFPLAKIEPSQRNPRP